MEYKTQTLFAFYIDGYSYAHRVIVQSNGAFKNKGMWRVVYARKGSKHQIRDKDRKYFKALGVDTKGMEIHHEWENGAITRLLTPEQHKQTEEGAYRMERTA